jgi:hypothetical protein
MEILKDPWFWVAIMIVLIVVVVIIIIGQIIGKPPASTIHVRFSVNDIGYGFKVKLIDKPNSKFLVRYMLPKVGDTTSMRMSTCWYKTTGIPEEVLTPKTMFMLVKDDGGLKFQKVVFASYKMNEYGGVERTYKYVDECYSLPAKYLQEHSGYVCNLFDDILDMN